MTEIIILVHLNLFVSKTPNDIANSIQEVLDL